MTLPLRQKTEFGTLREVILGRTEEAAFPPKSKANANFTDHVADLGPAFYAKYKEGERIPFADAKPELVEAYDQMHADLTKAYESEGATVQRINPPTKEIINYWAYTSHGYWPATLASLWQIFGNVVVEMIVSDNILECAPAGFAARDVFMERFENDPDAIWLSLPPGMPVDKSKGAGPGPFLSGGDIRILDEKTVICGCAWQKGRSEAAASNPAGVEVLRRILRPFGYEVHQINTNADISFHFDFVLGLVAPGVYCAPEGIFLDGIPEPLKDWDVIWVNQDEVNHGACNIVPMGPDASKQHRVVVPAKTQRMNDEIAKRGVKPIPVECELGARNGGGIRCATLVLNRDD